MMRVKSEIFANLEGSPSAALKDSHSRNKSHSLISPEKQTFRGGAVSNQTN